MPRVIVSVTNDLNSDQRVQKVCETFQRLGYEVLLVGRKLSTSVPIKKSYRTYRMRLIFNKGFLFYSEFNKRLFLKLLFTKTDVLYANDLDTLMANFMVAKLRRKKLIYDSHELFTEIPELEDRPFVKGVWKTIERLIFKRLKHVITVNNSIANYYQEKYNIPVSVVKNIAQKSNIIVDEQIANSIKGDKKMLILQGTGINKDRGAEEAVLMMQYLNNCTLYIIGGGDVFKDLEKMIAELNLQNKIIIKSKMPYLDLMRYTHVADLGLSLDKGTNLNYRFSLPNKIFDFIQAKTPILVSNMVEVATLVNQHQIGAILKSHDPKLMADQVNTIFQNKALLDTWKLNLVKIEDQYTWENESKTLENIIRNLD